MGGSVAISMLLAACSGTAAPAAGGDPVLESGRDVYIRACASCHGAAGGGGRGPQLSEGAVTANYTLEEQTSFVANGRGGMPAFGESLTEDELDAVIRYTREIL